jgi:hypothetical protein
MSFTEVDIFGVYVAPISLMIVAAWLVLIPMRWAAARHRPLALRVASGPVRVRDLYDRAVYNRTLCCTLEC